jgi:hypothetical protein
LIDRLLGKDRDMLPDEKHGMKKAHFWEDGICKFYICGFCPHDLFTNTKASLGPCPKRHDNEMRREWMDCKEKSKYGFFEEFIYHLEKLIEDLEVAIQKNMRKLTVQRNDKIDPMLQQQLDQINLQSEDEFRLMESYNEKGRLSEVSEGMKRIEALKSRKQEILETIDQTNAISNLNRMDICKVCGAKLIVGDTDKRLASHLTGKQHTGFELIRRQIAEYYARRKAYQQEFLNPALDLNPVPPPPEPPAIYSPEKKSVPDMYEEREYPADEREIKFSRSRSRSPPPPRPPHDDERDRDYHSSRDRRDGSREHRSSRRSSHDRSRERHSRSDRKKRERRHHRSRRSHRRSPESPRHHDDSPRGRRSPDSPRHREDSRDQSRERHKRRRESPDYYYEEGEFEKRPRY